MPTHQCAKCRGLFGEVRDAGLLLASLKPSTATVTDAATGKARIGYLTLAAVYRIHKGECRGRKGQTA